jgi:Domain of unknown function (DUF4832)/Domain of unknown function (DUF4874)
VRLRRKRSFLTAGAIAVTLMAGVVSWGRGGKDRSEGGALGAPVSFVALHGDLLNPERGWMAGQRDTDHRRGSLRLDDTDKPEDYQTIARTSRLAYAGVRLDSFGQARRDFRRRDLDMPLLAQLRRGFERVRAAGFKVVLRFTYNDPRAFPGQVDDDAAEGQILRHIEQLAPVLTENSDVIALLEAGFVGAWGEWHNSTNCLTSDLGDLPVVARGCEGRAHTAAEARGRILAALLAAVPPTRAVAVRQPQFRVAAVAGQRAAERPFSDTAVSRLGFHDDCLFADESDRGTFSAEFPRGVMETPPLLLAGIDAAAGPGNIAAWREYVARETAFVAFGGETCNPIREDAAGICPSVVAVLRAFHATFLNSSFYKPVLERWRREGCFDEVGASLGYRLQLLEAQWSDEVSSGQLFRLTWRMINTGFATFINPRPLIVVIDDGTHAYSAQVAPDARTLWPPGRQVATDVRLALPPEAPPGAYNVYLWLADPAPALARRPEYAIRLANEGLWRQDGRNAGMNALTSLDHPLLVQRRRGPPSRSGIRLEPLELPLTNIIPP